MSEQDFWQSWSDLIGKDALVIQRVEKRVTVDPVPGWFEECHKVEIENLPPPSRMAKDFHFLLCKNFNGKEPVITGAW